MPDTPAPPAAEAQTTRSDAEIAEMAQRSRALRGADQPRVMIAPRRRPPPAAGAVFATLRPKAPAGGAHGKR
jgi:hypothetical protein